MRVFTYPFQVDSSGKIRSTTNYDDVVRGQVIDALMTNQGERVMRPRYGCDIQASLFDPQDELVRKDAGSMIKDRLSQLVTRALVRSVTIGIEDTQSSSSVFSGGGISAAVVNVTYRSALYATDTVLTVPTSSEFIQRQINLSGEDTV